MSYQSVILADSPVAYWPLDETSGAVAKDASGNGNNMAYQNSPTLGAAPIAAGLGASVSLNGTTQFVDIETTPALLQLVIGSFEIWCNQSTVNKGAALFTTVYSAPTSNFMIGQGLAKQYPPQSDYIWGGSYNTSWVYAGDVSALSANTAYHVVYTNDGTSSRLYINGALAYTGTGQSFVPSAIPICIGVDDPKGPYFVEGLLSNAAMYNTVLTAAQILNHYNAGIATPSGSPLYTGGGTDSQFLLLQR